MEKINNVGKDQEILKYKQENERLLKVFEDFTNENKQRLKKRKYWPRRINVFLRTRRT